VHGQRLEKGVENEGVYHAKHNVHLVDNLRLGEFPAHLTTSMNSFSISFLRKNEGNSRNFTYRGGRK
jgi:hypothetical protein